MSTDKRKISKGITDIILLIGLIGTFITTNIYEGRKGAIDNGAKVEDVVFSWSELHCIISIVFIAAIIIHIWQHWSFYKVLVTKNLYLKNKLTTLTTVLFIGTVISILLYLTGFTYFTLYFHHITASIFVLIALIHFLARFKQMIRLFKK